MDTPSKSQRKRDVEALQALAIKLAKLPPAHLAQLPIPGDLLDAIEIYKGIKSNGARRRQAQFLGRVMREIDPEPILAALQKLQAQRT